MKMNHEHSHHDHSAMMASQEAASDYLKRFFIVTALLVPLFIFRELGQSILQFVVATIIF
jgi:hypothetical protein